MVPAAAGYGSVLLAGVATAYAGRAWTSPAAPMALLAGAGVVAVLAAYAVVAARLLARSGGQQAALARRPAASVRQRAGVVK
jgi:hypothetical protein